MTKFLAIKELKAVESVATPDRLVYRLNESKTLLKDKYKRKFIINRKTIDYKNKCVYSIDKTLKLQWYLRNNPSMPESYYNQQTTRGIVVLEEV